MATIDRSWDTTQVIADPGAVREVLPQGAPAVRFQSSRDATFHRVFGYVMLLYVFMFISRLPELVSWLHIGLILQPVLLIGLVMTKETTVLLRVRPARWLLVLTVWIGVCVPFSLWPGGSFQTLIKTILSLLMVAYILAFTQSIRDLMRLLAVTGWASSAIALLSFFTSTAINNRQGLGGSASLADPNFFATYLLTGLACLCLTVAQGRGFARIFSLVLIPLNVYGVLRSGSRAGLLTLVSGLIMFMVYGSKKQRAALLVACFAGLALSTVYLPDKVKDRLTDWFAPGAARAFFAPESAERASVESDQDIGVTTAEASSEARLYLLRRSLILTAKNPIFGVGPDQFPEAETRDAEENGGHGLWHASHNTYTQMSSETGIAGLVLFVGALYWSYSGLSAIRKNGPTREIRQIALFLQTAYFMLLVGAFFLSLGYGGLLFAMIGFSAAFKRAVRSYVEDSNPQALQPKMSLAV
ncbi:MAG TPA: O-antigen ligase family protein [Candidatus Angelobacter sp.]|nr:O-antigen ligase family protein [Candidatus Angelobacter sp.]